MNIKKSYSRWGSFFFVCHNLMHEVVPSVVAIAVRTVMTKCRIFCQSSFLFMFWFMSYDLWFLIYELWCRDVAFIKLKIENWKLKNVFVFAVGTQRAALFFFTHLSSGEPPFCHPDDRREEGSRQHPLHAALCYRDPSLHYVPFRMTQGAGGCVVWFMIMNYELWCRDVACHVDWCMMYNSWPLTLTIRMATHKS